MAAPETEPIDTVVIGAGQSGLSVGYHLARRGVPFVILDAGSRVGDSWRTRWDSLRLFTPARYDGLDGMRFPAPPHYFPTKDEMADYLEAYARRLALPVRLGVKVDGVTRNGDTYRVTAGDRRFEAAHVVLAMADFQVPRVPAFARDLDPRIVQLHSKDYRRPAQLQEGPVLVVGAGNSGAEIGLDLARAGRRAFLSGRDTGHVPFRIEGRLGRLLLPLVFRVVFHRVLTVNTPLGRRVRAKALSQGALLIRAKPRDLEAAGIERLPRTVGVRDGQPLLDDGRVLDVPNVIWCTGFEPACSWVSLPVFEPNGAPRHEAGRAVGEPGLYFVGRQFLYAFSSTMIHGIGRDAARVAADIAARRAEARESAGGFRLPSEAGSRA